MRHKTAESLRLVSHELHIKPAFPADNGKKLFQFVFYFAFYPPVRIRTHRVPFVNRFENIHIIIIPQTSAHANPPLPLKEKLNFSP